MGSITDSAAASYKFEQLDKNRLKDLTALYRSVYGREPGSNYYLAKYDTLYTGKENIGYIAYDKLNEPVAFYGVIPCFIKYKDQTILAAQSADTMTHPQHRNKGLFVELAKVTFELCRSGGIRLVFGFPNQNSYHGLVKLGWGMAETMERFTILVKTIPLKSLSEVSKWTRSIYRGYSTRLVRKYFYSRQGLPNSFVTEQTGGLHRDEGYLNYKTYSSSEVIMLNQTKIWVKIQNDLSVGDVEMVDDDEGFDRVMAELKKLARRLGITRIHFQTSPGTWLSRALKKRYAAVLSFPIMFLELGANIDLNKIKFTLADIDIF